MKESIEIHFNNGPGVRGTTAKRSVRSTQITLVALSGLLGVLGKKYNFVRLVQKPQETIEQSIGPALYLSCHVLYLTKAVFSVLV